MLSYLKQNGMSILTINKSHLATDVNFTDDKMILSIEDGRELSIPLEWFSGLRKASSKQLTNWRFIGGGDEIHWSEIDEDISVENLLD